MTDQIRTPRDALQAMHDSITNDLVNAWGGRLPTWAEYKIANKSGRVRANKNIGMKAIYLQGVPRGFLFLFGIVTPWGMCAAPVACIILAILGVWGWWTIIPGLFTSWFLYKVSLEGAAAAIRYGAEENEALYQALVSRGAFLFSPAESPPPQRNAELLGALGELMERYPTALLETARLPATKQKMKDVIKQVWQEQPELRRALAHSYLYLSHFQDGIGDAVLDCKLPENSVAAIRREGPEGEGLRQLMTELAGPAGESFRQWSMWSKVSTAEIEILAQEWEQFDRSGTLRTRP